MNRLGADDSRCALSTDKHLLPHQMAQVYSADHFEAIEPFAFLIHDHQTDFVHVSVEHHAGTLPPAPSFGYQDISQRVHFYFIGVWPHLLQHDLAHLALITRDRDDVTESFEKF